MDVKAWGPSSWKMLFFVAAGYELNTDPPQVKNPHYYKFFEEVGYVLGCRYCRDSYKDFFQALKLEEYMGKKCGVLKFVYDLKNKVNSKLVKQELDAAFEEYQNIVNNKSLTNVEIALKLRDISKIFYTKDPPEFKEIVDEYMKHQAQCSSKMKTCRKGALQSTGNKKPVSIFPQQDTKNVTDTMFYKGITGGKTPYTKKSLRKRMTKRKTRSIASRKRKTTRRKK